MQRDYEQFPEDANGEVLWEMRTKGDLLTEPRELDFSVIFPSEEAAVDFGASCLRGRFKVEIDEPEEKHEDGLNWEVIVYTTIIPTHTDITTIENALGEHAEPLGGRNSGWSSIFISSE